MPHVVFEQDLREHPDVASDAAVSCLVDLGIGCNLRCAGCSGRSDAVALTVREARALRNHVLARARDGAADQLSVAFYGGEPLMEADAVATLSARIRRSAVVEGISYRGVLVTNGTLLGPVVAQRLAASGLGRVQVTLEGPDRMHDRQRRTLDGDGTFHTIVPNLRMARNDVEVVVRANVGENGPALVRLVAALERAGLFDPPSPVTLFVARPAPYVQQARDLLKLFTMLASLRGGRPAAPHALH